MNVAVKERPGPPELETAVAWSYRLRQPGCSAEDQRAFEAWLAQSPAHEAAYAEVRRASAIVDRLQSDPRLKALDAATDRELAAADRARRVRRLAAIAASLIVTGLVATGVLVWRKDTSQATVVAELPAYETPVGERSTITLEDGSAVTLNTDSRIEVDYTEALRRVRLVRGQAYFDVTADADRPFVAEAGDTRVVALGTAFDVRLAGTDALEVTLVEGRVGVVAADEEPGTVDAARPPIELTAGERLTLRTAAVPQVSRPDLTAIRAWRSGMLVFDNTPLADVVAEVNRYSTQKLALADDARLKDIRISGGFRAGEVTNLVGVLTGMQPIDVKRTGTYQQTLVWSDENQGPVEP